MDENGLYLTIREIIDRSTITTFEQLDALKDEIDSVVGTAFQNYSDEEFEGKCI